MRGDISSSRFCRMANSELRKACAPVRTVIPCSIRKARIWLIVAVRLETSLERTRCNACRSSWSWLFSPTSFRFGRKRCFGNPFGVVVVVLLTLHEGLGVLGRNDPRLKAQPAQCAADEVSTQARLQSDDAARQLLERCNQRQTLDLAPQNNAAIRIKADKVEDVLADIDAKTESSDGICLECVPWDGAPIVCRLKPLQANPLAPREQPVHPINPRVAINHYGPKLGANRTFAGAVWPAQIYEYAA